MKIEIQKENPLTVDEMAMHLIAVKKELTAANKKARELSTAKANIEKAIIEALDAGEDADEFYISISETEEPNVIDFEAALAYVIETQGWHLLQRRLSAPALREELLLTTEIPGVGSKVSRKLSLKEL